MNILPDIYNKLSLFGDDEDFVVFNLVSPEFRALSRDLKGAYIQAFRFLSSSSSQYDLDTLRDFVAKPRIDQETPEIHVVHQGEDHSFSVALQAGDDYTGKNLVARIAEDHAPLSVLTIAGDSYANAPTQQIPIVDLGKLAGGFYRVHLTLENVTSGSANGDAAALLKEVLLVVRELVDSDE